MDRPESKAIYSIRQHTVEPVFGNIKYNLGYRTFLLRGLGKVSAEFALMCSAHNLLKLLAEANGKGQVWLHQALNSFCTVTG